MPSKYDKYSTHHTSRRMDSWDYTSPGAYFITIITDSRRHLFGRVEDGRMYLNDAGRIVAEEWHRTGEIRDNVHLDAFVVMPNHVHGIIVILPPDVDAPVGPRGYDVSRRIDFDAGSERRIAMRRCSNRKSLYRPPNSIGSIVSGFKGAVTTRLRKSHQTPGAKIWQRNYNDRIIRDERHWRSVRRHIKMNPARQGSIFSAE